MKNEGCTMLREKAKIQKLHFTILMPKGQSSWQHDKYGCLKSFQEKGSPLWKMAAGLPLLHKPLNFGNNELWTPKWNCSSLTLREKLRLLHWLPIETRIHFKIVVLTFASITSALVISVICFISLLFPALSDLSLILFLRLVTVGHRALTRSAPHFLQS